VEWWRERGGEKGRREKSQSRDGRRRHENGRERERRESQPCSLRSVI